MKEQSQSCQITGLKYCLAPIIFLFAAAGIIYLSSILTLPEGHQNLYPFLLIVTSLLVFCFLLIAVPCGLYSIYLAVKSVITEKKYVLPIIIVLLDLAILVAWFFVMRKWIL